MSSSSSSVDGVCLSSRKEVGVCHPKKIKWSSSSSSNGRNLALTFQSNSQFVRNLPKRKSINPLNLLRRRNGDSLILKLFVEMK